MCLARQANTNCCIINNRISLQYQAVDIYIFTTARKYFVARLIEERVIKYMKNIFLQSIGMITIGITSYIFGYLFGHRSCLNDIIKDEKKDMPYIPAFSEWKEL